MDKDAAYNEDVTITVTDEASIDSSDRDVELNLSNHDLTIKANDETHGIRAKDHDLTISGANDISLEVIGTTSEDDGDGINVSGSSNVSIIASGKFDLTAHSKQADGIYVADSSSGNIDLNGSSISIDATNNGIDFRGAGSMTLGNEDTAPSLVEIKTSSGDGIRIADDKGSLTVNSNAVEITSGDDGVNAISGQLTLNSGSNFIYGAKNALHLSGGVLTVNALASSATTRANDLNNVYVGGETGLLIDAGEGLTHSIYAPNNNIFAGGNTGIKISADGSNTTITAGKTNTIGQYKPDDESELVLSKTGIDVAGGSLTLKADKNEIYASRVGIKVNSFEHNAQVKLEGSSVSINVDGGFSENNDYLYGINAKWDSEINANLSSDMDIRLDDLHGGVRGIYAERGSSVSLNLKNFNLDVTQVSSQGNGNPQDRDQKAFGIAVSTDTTNDGTPTNDAINSDGSTTLVQITANNNLTIDVSSSDGANQVAGIFNDISGKVILNADNAISVTAIGHKVLNSGTVAAIQKEKAGLISISSENEDIVLTSYALNTTNSTTVYGIVSKVGTADSGLSSETSVNAISGSVSIAALGNEFSSSTGVSSISSSKNFDLLTISANSKISIAAEGGTTIKGVSASTSGKNEIKSGSDITIFATGLEKVENTKSANIYGIDSFNGNNEITAAGNIFISTFDYADKGASYGLHTMANSSNASHTTIKGNSISLLSTADTAYGIVSETAGSTAKETQVTLSTEEADRNQLHDIVIAAYDAGIKASNNTSSSVNNLSIELLS